MESFDINKIEINSAIKFINADKTLFDGEVKLIANNCLGITVSVNQESVRQLNKGEIVQLIIIQKNELIKCCATVLGNRINDLEQYVVITEPKPILITERRKFQRLPLVMDIEYSVLALEEDYAALNDVNPKYYRFFKKTYTVDISAGGINIVILKKDKIGKYVLISFDIKNKKIVSLCRKVRIDTLKDSRYNNIAFEYSDIKDEDRQLILDYVTEKMK